MIVAILVQVIATMGVIWAAWIGRERPEKIAPSATQKVLQQPAVRNVVTEEMLARHSGMLQMILFELRAHGEMLGNRTVTKGWIRERMEEILEGTPSHKWLEQRFDAIESGFEAIESELRKDKSA